MSIFVGPNNEDMNRNIRLREVNVAQAKLVYPDGDYIDNDIILFEDITKVPLPASASRMKSLFLALCTGGSAQYTVDTKEHKVSAGDVIIISEEQVVADYQLSPDCEGIALIMSYDFFQNIVSGIHELAALFLFARTHPVFHLDNNQAKALENDIQHIKEKIIDTGHRFRRELVMTMLKALIIDMSDIIYRFQQVGEQDRHVLKLSSATSFRLWKRTIVRKGVSVGTHNNCVSHLNISLKPCVLSADVHQVIGLTPTLHVSYV